MLPSPFYWMPTSVQVETSYGHTLHRLLYRSCIVGIVIANNEDTSSHVYYNVDNNQIRHSLPMDIDQL